MLQVDATMVSDTIACVVIACATIANAVMTYAAMVGVTVMADAAIVGAAIAGVVIAGTTITTTAITGATPVATIVSVAPVGPTVDDAKTSHRASHVGDEPDKQVEKGLYETYHRFFATQLKYY